MKQDFLSDDIIAIAKNIYNTDLSGYKPSFINRRLKLIAMRKGIYSAPQFTDYLVNNLNFNQYLIEEIPVHVTSLFRDQEFFKSLTNQITLQYSNKNMLKIWHPGCANGSEVFSLALLLQSKKIALNFKSLGTDISHESILIAKSGVLKCKNLQEMQLLYRASGGQGSIREHIITSADSFVIKQNLYDKIKFSRHILGTDDTFTQFDVIVCRNMLMYYKDEAKERITKDLYESLHTGGLIAIGLQETIENLEVSKKLRIIDKTNKIYQKID